MANFKTVTEYRKVSDVRIQTTGADIRVNADEITQINWAGIGFDGGNDHNIFTVRLTNGRNFITDWAGIQSIDNFVRVNEYRKTKQEDGSTRFQYTTRGVRVRVNNIAFIREAGSGIDGESTNDCYRVSLVNGESFVTDSDGVNDIENYGA